MTNFIHNESTPLHPSGTASSTTNNNELFSNEERKRLNSFLDTPATSDERYSTNGHGRYTTTEDRNQSYAPGLATSSPPSPTPVLLSSPYSRNITFEQQQQPIHRKRSNVKGMPDDISTRDNNKKYRVLLEDPSAPLLDYFSHPPPTLDTISISTSTKETSDDVDPSAFKDATPPPVKPKGSGRGRKPVHELLSEDQKKANHIASEQKRRANIRIGFDQLVDIVPNLNECQRSESLILQKSADYIRQLVDTKNGLRDRVRELQTVLGEIPDEDSSEGEMDYGF